MNVVKSDDSRVTSHVTIRQIQILLGTHGWQLGAFDLVYHMFHREEDPTG